MPHSASISEVVALHCAEVFLVIALNAAVLGCNGFTVGAAVVAKILFFAFLILAIADFVFGRALRAMRS